MPKIQTLARQAAALLLLLCAWGAWHHARVLVAVSVTLLPDAEEVGDGFRSRPDYRLDLQRVGSEDWIELDVFPQKSIGAGLLWQTPRTLPMADLVALRLVEVDSANDDVLEIMLLSGSITGSKLSGQRYQFELRALRDPRVGIEWFVERPLGALTAMALLIAVLLSFLRWELK